MKKNRKAIVVLGMHRSGTSALTRVLSLGGVTLPKSLVPANHDNEKGFWESEVIYQLNDRFLSEIGSSWDDQRPVQREAYDSPAGLYFQGLMRQALIDEFNDAEIFILKDPRICRLLPLWMRVFKKENIDPYFILTVRHPDEVAASLRKRNNFNEEKSRALWQVHLVESERETRGYPRVFTSYDSLLSNWQDVAIKVRDELNLPLDLQGIDEKVQSFLSKELRHHQVKNNNFEKENHETSFTSIVIDFFNHSLENLTEEISERDVTITNIKKELQETQVFLQQSSDILKKLYKNQLRGFILNRMIGKKTHNKISKIINN